MLLRTGCQPEFWRKTIRTAEYLYSTPSAQGTSKLIEAKSSREETTYAAAPARLSNGFATVVPDNKIRNSTMNTVIIPSRCTDP